jgi:hypothetical protein
LSQTGITINSAGGQGGSPNTILGNAINGIYGYAIELGGTVANTVVVGNNPYAVYGAVQANTPAGNTILLNGADITLNPSTGVMSFGGASYSMAGNVMDLGSNSAAYCNYVMNAASGMPKQIIYSSAGEPVWLVGSVGGSADDFAYIRYVTPGTQTDAPVTIYRATGSVAMLHGLGIWGTAPPAAKPTITGSRGSALAAVVEQILQAGQNMGLWSDNTTS